MHAENLSVAAAFDLSYQDLAAAQQLFFRRLGLHPGTDIDARAAAAINDTDLAEARRRYAGASPAARPDGAQSPPVLFTSPVQIYKAVREQLRDPDRPRPTASAESRAAVTAQRPGIASVASFDTAFHITVPAASATYAILLA
jgi:hypothetical protein